MNPSVLGLAATFTILFPTAAKAAELFGGVHAHDVKTALDESGLEKGTDLSVGLRGGAVARVWRIEFQPYAFVSVNTAGNTDFAAAGIAARIPLGLLYLRPGIGIAVHDGSAGKYFRTDKIAFGSRVLFEPELAVGMRVTRRISIEASWEHLSHAQLFGPENPGMDDLGVRLNLAL